MARNTTEVKAQPVSLTQPPAGYAEWLGELKNRIHNAQQRATLAVNRELVLLYWQIGRDILARQASQGWGAKVIDRLAHDLRNAFPEMKGFSPRNLKYMRAVAEQIRAYVPSRYTVLGTDGYGRSDTREKLRYFFEVNRQWITVAALKALADDGVIAYEEVAKAIAKYNLDVNKPAPWTV